MTGKELIERYRSCLKGFEDIGCTNILEEMIDNALIEAKKNPVVKLHCSAGLFGEPFAFCDDCKTIKRMMIDPPSESIDGEYVGGDISCECGKIVATLYRKAR